MAPTATAPNGTDSVTTKSGQNVKNLKKDPIDRTWRGNKAGTITMDQRIPKFEDPYEEREWIKVCNAPGIVMFGCSYEAVYLGTPGWGAALHGQEGLRRGCHWPYHR